MTLPNLGGLRLGERRAASTGKLAKVRHATTEHEAMIMLPSPKGGHFYAFDVTYTLTDGELADGELDEFISELRELMTRENYPRCTFHQNGTHRPIITGPYDEPSTGIRRMLERILTGSAMKHDGPKFFLWGKGRPPLVDL